MNRTKKGIKTRNRTKMYRGIATFVAALMAATPAWAGSLVIEGALASSGVSNSVTIDNATLIIQTGTGSGTLSTDNATAFVATATGSTLSLQGTVSIDNITTVKNLTLFGGSSTGNTVATLVTDNLTVTGTTSVTGADYNKNFIATNFDKGLVQSVGTAAVIYPIGTASASRAVSLAAASDSGNIFAYADHSTISLTNKTTTARSITTTGLFTSHTSSYATQTLPASGTLNVNKSNLLIPDTVAPANGGISLDSGNAVSTDSTVTVSLSATDAFGVTGYALQVDNSTKPTSTAGFTTVSPSFSLSTTVNYTFPTGMADNRTIFAFYKDDAGNISAADNDSILLDLAAPVGVSASINDGSADTETTTKQSASVVIKATDDSGITGYYIGLQSSIQPNAGSFISVASANTYSDNVTLNLLSAEGTQTIYVWFTDIAGNISTVITDSIEFSTGTGTDTSITSDQTIAADGTENNINTSAGTITVKNDGGKVTATTANGSKFEVSGPAGTATKVKTDGTIEAEVTVGGVTALASMDANGASTNKVTVGGKTTTFKPPADATTTIAADGAVKSSSTKNGKIIELTANADGTLSTGHEVDGKKTSTTLPAGSTANTKSSGAVSVASELTVGGASVTLNTGISSDGVAELLVPAFGNNKTVLLGPAQPGDSISVSGTVVTLTTSLGGSASSRTSSSSASGNFVGRYPSDGSEVLVYPSTTGATFNISRDLTGTTSTVSLATGSATIDYGNFKGTSMGAAPFQITNDAVVLPIAIGANYSGVGVMSTLTPASMELKFDDVHSVWTYSNSSSSWQAYSADSSIQSALSGTTGITALASSIEPGTGMFIYSSVADNITLADAKDLSVETRLTGQTLGSGWHLLAAGNKSDTPAEIMATNSSIESIWVASGSSFKVYATNSDLVTKITTEGYTALDANEKLGASESIWIHVASTTNRSSGRLVAPPVN